ncbi:MAG TPA: DUF4124 domain-containing protein [Candidatus Competibacteraceae bacterium]|nr:DUF4124 domain-containing protein [Candidatus Competibacteraceae bacterium]
MRKIRLLGLVLVAGIVPAMAGTLYKWTDPNGVVQYTETPPPGGTPYSTVGKPPKPAEDPARTMQQLRDKVEQATQQDQAAEQPAEQPPQDRKELYARNCELARKNLQVLEGDSDVVVTGKGGNKTVLDAAQRKAHIAQTQKEIQFYCDQPQP